MKKGKSSASDLSPLKFFNSDEEKVFLKTNLSWACALNLNQARKNKIYFIEKNFLNKEKISRIFPKFDVFFPDCNRSFISNQYFKLREYQKNDVDFFKNKKSAAIFSEMRTGKTPTALMIYENWPVKSLLIIVPGILENQWQRSVEEWLFKPAYSITSLNKVWRHYFYEKLLNENNFIVIVSKDTFKLDSKEFNKIKKKKNNYCIIIDEAHYLRNYNSQQSKSIYKVSDCEYKIVLTGTPSVNHPSDVFGILKFLEPNKYSSFWKFVEEFFFINKRKIISKNKNFLVREVGNFKNSKTTFFFQKLVSKLSINRRQKEVMPWLPPIMHQKELLFMTEEQSSFYNKLLEERGKDYNSLELFSKLKTLTLFPPNFGLEEIGVKAKFLISFIEEKQKNPLIVFSSRSETFLQPMAKLLEEKKINFGIITGDTDRKCRNEEIDKFQDGILDILLCSIKVVSLGLNLSRAETVIFVDRSYSPAENDQAEARFLPNNYEETKKVRLIIDLVCKGTIDEKVIYLLEKKKNITDYLNNTPEFFFT